MNVAESVVGAYRVYGAAPADSRGRGFLAAVVVRHHGPLGGGREVFRDEQLADGQIWTNSRQALRVALDVGEAAIRAQHALALVWSSQTE